jgi:hypothetical protein|tara:strand:+ start:169 stop:405 length:237 start_codon:yes stop_codon:yes gene_type:complete
MNTAISYTHMGSYGDAEYFRYEIDYSDLSDEPTDRDIINGAAEDNYGGYVTRGENCVTVYPAQSLVDTFEIDGGVVQC